MVEKQLGLTGHCHLRSSMDKSKSLRRMESQDFSAKKKMRVTFCTATPTIGSEGHKVQTQGSITLHD